MSQDGKLADMEETDFVDYREASRKYSWGATVPKGHQVMLDPQQVMTGAMLRCADVLEAQEERERKSRSIAGFVRGTAGLLVSAVVLVAGFVAVHKLIEFIY